MASYESDQHRPSNLFQELQQRELTEAEQKIIQERVEKQRKLFEEYEKRELSRKITEIQEIIEGLSSEEATLALNLCEGREDVVMEKLLTDASFQRLVRGSSSYKAPVQRDDQQQVIKPQRIRNINQSNQPFKIGGDANGIFIGSFKGKLGPHQLAKLRSTKIPQNNQPTIDVEALTSHMEQDENNNKKVNNGDHQNMALEIHGQNLKRPRSHPKRVAIDSIQQLPYISDILKYIQSSQNTIQCNSSSVSSKTNLTEDINSEQYKRSQILLDIMAQSQQEQFSNTPSLEQQNNNVIQPSQKHQQEAVAVITQDDIEQPQNQSQQAEKKQKRPYKSEKNKEDMSQQLLEPEQQQIMEIDSQNLLNRQCQRSQQEFKESSDPSSFIEILDSQQNQNDQTKQERSTDTQIVQAKRQVTSKLKRKKDINQLQQNNNKQVLKDSSTVQEQHQEQLSSDQKCKKHKSKNSQPLNLSSEITHGQNKEQKLQIQPTENTIANIEQSEQQVQVNDIAQNFDGKNTDEDVQQQQPKKQRKERCDKGKKKKQNIQNFQSDVQVQNSNQKKDTVKQDMLDQHNNTTPIKGILQNDSQQSSQSQIPPQSQLIITSQSNNYNQEHKDQIQPQDKVQQQEDVQVIEQQKEQSIQDLQQQQIHDQHQQQQLQQHEQKENQDDMITEQVQNEPQQKVNKTFKYQRDKHETPHYGRIKQKGVKKAELIQIGNLRPEKNWYNSGYIFPEGFEARTVFRSSLQLDAQCIHACQILEDPKRHRNGRPLPLFRVIAYDRPEEPIDSQSCTGCWTGVLKRISHEISYRISQGENLPPPPKTAIAGPEYFGLNQRDVIQQIEALDSHHLCKEYWVGKEALSAAIEGQSNGYIRSEQEVKRSNTKAINTSRSYQEPRPRSRRNEDEVDDEDEYFKSLKWSGVDRAERYRRRQVQEDVDNNPNQSNYVMDDDNPMPNYLDPITLEPVVTPAISPYGHVMGMATWKAVLSEQQKCPFTKNPLKPEQCKILTKINFARFEDKIINIQS